MADLKFPDTDKSSSQEPEIDYSPKEYSLRKLLLIGLIFAAGVAIFILPIVLCES
ncbi:hypothetical protein LF599_03745 [Pseudodesulfovibrio thermohalotolerans]|jgi:hypothetical protein|uniref:hypothetical protein n=1 Tax=Pseudodesulfovibrio thermohalotolerans TaxID=2880651 RepID=UPI0022BA09C7|nr:hypothetical protein [Pseudodesulfovibrio thermohalotolerans]WFS63290.1 hypothetical protein LF599_03745 [Pseudodesulfovibrio thermohalotolerans]